MRASMSQTKTTRAFRTISEAGDELGLQPHVLRFWESKFSHIKPIKRGGGRRFYRPEDIEFIRGIKKLLHDEKHPIKDVQKLIQKKGAARVVELGRSLEKAAREQSVADTDLLPQRIIPAASAPRAQASKPKIVKVAPAAPEPIAQPQAPPPPPPPAQVKPVIQAPPPLSAPSMSEKLALEDALKRLEALKAKLSDFRKSGTTN